MSTSVTPQRTPLFAIHRELGAKLIDFGGWEMPVYYSTIVDEHRCVRRASGIFDISHMGEVLVRGAGAAAFLNQLLTNDIYRLEVGQAQYTLMCREDGGVVDDLYAYRVGLADYLLVINASRIQADIGWITALWETWDAKEEVTVENASDRFAAVALQGPRVVQFMERLVPGPSTGGRRVESVLDLKKNEIGAWPIESRTLWVSRTGYTGEDGFEVVLDADHAVAFWKRAQAEGHLGCLQPCGLGARDTLRTEMGYPLYGHELDETISPVEAGLGVFVGWDKAGFSGKTVLANQKEQGVARKCVALRAEPKAPPLRPGYPIFHNEKQVGHLVSGTQSPSLGCGIGMGYVVLEHAKPDTELTVEIRGRQVAVRVCRKPLYRPETKS